jgi:hypothetical protein
MALPNYERLSREEWGMPRAPRSVFYRGRKPARHKSFEPSHVTQQKLDREARKQNRKPR